MQEIINMPFWKKLSDLFDEKVKDKKFTIDRTEKDVWEKWSHCY